MEITLADDRPGKVAFHEIEANITAIFESMDEADNPDDPAYLDALEAALVEMADAETAKADGLAFVMARMEAEAEAIKQTIAALGRRKGSLEGRVVSLKGYVLKVMQAHGLKQIKGQSVTFSIRKGIESVVVDPTAVDTLPFDLVRTKIEPDKTAIKKAIQEGREIAGAGLVTGPETLSIRR